MYVSGMSDQTRPTSPLASLTEAQQERLKGVTSLIHIDKITLSHSIEERAPDGRKTSAFYSVTASRGTGAEITQLGEDARESLGFTPDEAKIARLVLGKHVVAAVYDDAIKRGVLKASAAQEEVRAILTRYDMALAKVLGHEP